MQFRIPVEIIEERKGSEGQRTLARKKDDRARTVDDVCFSRGIGGWRIFEEGGGKFEGPKSELVYLALNCR